MRKEIVLPLLVVFTNVPTSRYCYRAHNFKIVKKHKYLLCWRIANFK